MRRIDAHQHFWRFDPVRDSWITDDMDVIQKDFLPVDLQPLLTEFGIDGCITVQSDQSDDENRFQLENAAQNKFIKGIVGWVDLTSRDVEDRLAYWASYPTMKGFRHVLQGEMDRALMLKRSFMNGIGMLGKFNFAYDLLIHNDQLKYLPHFVKAFPGQRFVIDHMGKPGIKSKELATWASEITAVAQFENVYCKISGVVTEADWRKWTDEDISPFIDVVVQAFGTRRIMFGSDWPVCLVAASYRRMFHVVTTYFSKFSEYEQALFFGENAIRFYNLETA